MLLPSVVQRTPCADKTVRNTGTALFHEMSWHIGPAINQVRKFVEPWEKVYSSKEQCEGVWRNLQQFVPWEFKAALRATQLREPQCK